MKKVLLAVLVICLVFSLIGCVPGSGNNQDSEVVDGNNENAENDDNDVKDDKIVVTLTTEILTLDPQISAGTPAEVVRKHIYEGLVFANENNEISPLLAESWTVSDDGLEWTFMLKEGVKFHDGESFNAEAVKRTFDRYKTNEGSSRRYIYSNLIEVEVVDEYTVKFITEKPQSNFLNLLAYGGGAILSQKSHELDPEEVGKNPIGTGPFRLKESVSNEYVIVEKFDEYWGDVAQLSEIKFVTVKEAATRVNMLETGEADYIVGVTAQDVDRLEQDAQYEVRYDKSNRVAQIGFNITKAPFDNKLVRQAMNYAINRETIVNGIYSGIGEPADSVIAPATWGHSDTKMYEHNMEKAKELLAEAGYPDGFTAKIWTPDGRYFKDKESVMAFVGQMQEVGINLEVEVIDWGQYLKELKIPNEEGNRVELYMLGWESTTGEANYLFNSVFTSKNIAPKGWNTMFYSNERVDELNELATACMDDEQRYEYFKEMQMIIMDESPWVPMFVFGQVAVHRSDLEGINVLPIEVPLFTKAYIK